MFVQNYHNGKIYKNLSTMQYVLKIDGDEYFGESILKVLKLYSKSQFEKLRRT